MWREKVQALSKAAVFGQPADLTRLRNAADRLRLDLPNELHTLLAESDGIVGEYSLGLIWNCERIVTHNLNFRKDKNFIDLYMPFDCLLFFADAGNGDQFAFAIRNGQIQSSDVYVWDHENDSRTWVAPSLQKYLEWWLEGKIKL
jgi:hypothetical protein